MVSRSLRVAGPNPARPTKPTSRGFSNGVLKLIPYQLRTAMKRDQGFSACSVAHCRAGSFRPSHCRAVPAHRAQPPSLRTRAKYWFAPCQQAGGHESLTQLAESPLGGRSQFESGGIHHIRVGWVDKNEHDPSVTGREVRCPIRHGAGGRFETCHARANEKLRVRESILGT